MDNALMLTALRLESEVVMVVAVLYIVKEAGEIPLKSARTRPRFERRLMLAIREALRRNGLEGRIDISQGVLFVEAPEPAREVLKKVFGVHSVCEAISHRFSNIDDIATRAKEIYSNIVREKKFAVRVKRAGKHSFTSMDVARAVGSALLPYSAGVNLTNPEVVVRIEIRGDMAFYIINCVKGPGGLPVGTGGKGLALFSGGFDSTASSWLAAKRGVEVDFLHLYLGSIENSLRAVRIARRLGREWFSPHNPRIMLVDATPLTAWIKLFVRQDLRQVVLRVLMHEVAQSTAARYGYDAVITGEALGQASSQTLLNLRVVDTLVRNRRALVVRPVLCFDKEEVVELIRAIGLYEEVEKVKEVCRISEGPQATRAKASQVAVELGKIPDSIVKGAVEKAVFIDPPLDTSKVKEVLESFDRDVVIDKIGKDMIPVDARGRREFMEWHLPGAIHIEDVIRGEPPKEPLVVYCWHGTLSKGIAKALRMLGIEAFALSKPLSELRLEHGAGKGR